MVGFRVRKFSPGFTLIELLVVIAIIGVLAAVALPLYSGYTIAAKLSEVENALSTVASGATTYYENQGTWPSCPTINEVETSLGVGMRAVSRVSAISVSNTDGSITATVNNIHSMVDGKTLILSPSTSSDGSIKWNWGWSADFPPQFRPKS
jgi:type IV pilus assembly protein PilA